MASVKLKICGMRDVNNITEVAALGPDYMGFIFYPKSPRYVGETFEIPADFPTNIIRVGVFVNDSTSNMIEKARLHKIDFLQLHGQESVQQCMELKSHNLQIIKALSVGEESDFRSTKFYSAAVDFWLFDTKGKYYGGNAKVFNWKLLERYDQSKPFFLSGGLNAENVDDTKELLNMNLHSLDVNSGVERKPAVKDIEKIKSIKNIIKSKSYAVQG